MPPAKTPPPTAPPNDPVREALDVPGIREDLVVHARAILVRRLVHRDMSVRAEAAEEAVHDTIVRALEIRHRFDPSKGKSVCAWVHGILNLVLHEKMRQLLGLPAQRADDDWWDQRPDQRSEATEAVIARLDAPTFLARLSADQRAILELRYRENLSQPEIAVRLNISPGNARVRLSRALTALAALTADEPKEGQP